MDGVNDAKKENNIKNKFVKLNEIFSLNFIFLNTYKSIPENKDTCNPDKANK